MKNLLLSIVLLIFVSTYSQTTKTELLYKDKKYDISIHKFDGNTGSYILWTWSFQNSKYQHIIDSGTILFKNSEEIKKFINDCESFIGLARNTGQTLESNKNELSDSNYNIAKLSDSSLIFVCDNETKCKMFTQKNLEKFLESLNKSLESYLKT